MKIRLSAILKVLTWATIGVSGQPVTTRYRPSLPAGLRREHGRPMNEFWSKVPAGSIAADGNRKRIIFRTGCRPAQPPKKCLENWRRKLAAWGKFTLKPKTRYQLEVRKTGKKLEVSVKGHTLGFLDESLPEKFYVGVTGCEGINRFYDFQISR